MAISWKQTGPATWYLGWYLARSRYCHFSAHGNSIHGIGECNYFDSSVLSRWGRWWLVDLNIFASVHHCRLWYTVDLMKFVPMWGIVVWINAICFSFVSLLYFAYSSILWHPDFYSNDSFFTFVYITPFGLFLSRSESASAFTWVSILVYKVTLFMFSPQFFLWHWGVSSLMIPSS